MSQIKQKYDLNGNSLYDVLCIGDAAIDITLSVPRLPDRDDKVVGSVLSEQVGGTAANCACVCSSLGLDVATLANVGNDKDGSRILAEYRKYRVAEDFVSTIEGLEAFKVIAMLDESGEKSMVLLPPKSVPYPTTSLENAIRQSRYVYTMPGDSQLLENISACAQKLKRKLVVDIEPTTFDTSQQLHDILSYADLAIFNKKGYEKAFAESPSPHALQQLVRQFNLDGVCVTLGQEGAVAQLYGKFACLPAFDTTVIDTTGAGDTFNASFIYAIIHHYDVAKALRFASASAALSVGAIGPKGFIPSCENINQFLAEHNP